jgi:hypothetical protein
MDVLDSYCCQAKLQSVKNGTLIAYAVELKNRLCANFDLQVVPGTQLVTLTYMQPEGPQGGGHM